MMKRFLICTMTLATLLLAQSAFATPVPVGPSQIDGGSSDFNLAMGKAVVECTVYHGYAAGNTYEGKYVYTYKVKNINSGVGISFFNVGILSGANAESPDSDGSAGGILPISAMTAGTPVESVNYMFANTIADASESAILWFVSSDAPTSGNGGVLGTLNGMPVFGTGSLLTPNSVPEPVTAALLGLGSLAIIRSKKKN